MKPMTREWMRKAEADFQLASEATLDAPPYRGQKTFLCQQSAEKYLKALLEHAGVTPPRTHILGDLLTMLRPHYPSLRPLGRGLKFLTRFAVGIRYPGEYASKRQAEAALRWAGRVRAECRTLLGIKPARPGL